jgi:hypothetical protein
MTTRKSKTPKQHPKIVNEWMIYESINDINSVFGAISAFEAYMQSPQFSKYHASLALHSIKATLCAGTQMIEEWIDIKEETE